ncbi:MAG: ABC transporter substrate-binding protein [Candidatus Sumerlaeaceae bacterium]|nr:ABC transporter substrate-binding protein [Candidatus Sumerlaeaceae bacterium]
MRHTQSGLVIMTAACGLLLAGCGGSGPQGNDKANPTGQTSAKPAASAQKVFTYANVAEPRRLDPAFMYDVYEGIVSGYMYDGLVLFDPENKVVPGLAEKWEVASDGKTYTFHLRDAKFSNGKPVTSADVRYSFTRLLRPETNSNRKWLFDNVTGVEAVTSGTAKELSGLETPDPKTVIFKLDRPYPAFLTKLAMPNAVIIPENSAGVEKPDKQFEAKPIGSGPWVLDKWVHDQRMEFKRNEFFWGNNVKLDKLIYQVTVNDRVQQQQFEVGNLDTYAVSFTVWPQWSRDPAKRDRMMPVQELVTFYVAMMNNKPHLKDKRVRQAISHGINIKSIFENLQQGRGIQAHGSVPYGIEGYRPDIPPRAYDPEKARKLLAEAGVKDLTLNYWFTDDNLTGEIASAIKSDLEKIGVQVNLARRDTAAFRQAIVGGEPDLYSYSWWLDYPDIENALIPSFHTRNIPYGGNGCRYSNPKFDKLVDAAQNEPDPKKRIEMFQKAEDMIIEDCPWVFSYHRRTYNISQPWVQNYKPAIMYNADRYTDVDIDLAKKPR